MRIPTWLMAMSFGSLLHGQEAGGSFQDGLLALQQDRHQQAIDAFTLTVAAEPNHARAWYYRGLSREQLGDHVGAMHDLDRALVLDPSDANVLLRRADVYLAAGHPQEARADLHALLQRHPTGHIAVHALFSLGRCGVALGEYDAAFEAYDRSVSLAPHDARTWCDRGIARAHLGDHIAAIADLGHAIEMDPTLDKAYVSRAVELILLDRASEACADLQKAKALGDLTVDEMLAIYCY
jgi:tetratricopeptide (TPR) repeat protein